MKWQEIKHPPHRLSPSEWRRLWREGKNGLGRFSVEVEIENYDDVVLARAGGLSSSEVRRVRLRAVVDCAASDLVLPGRIAKALGLPVVEKVNVRYADRRIGKRDLVQNAHVTLEGRSGVFDAVVEPKEETALIGAIILQSFDLLVDCKEEKLMRRDPRFRIVEI